MGADNIFEEQCTIVNDSPHELHIGALNLFEVGAVVRNAERIGDGAHGSERREKEHLGVRAAAEERRNAARHRRVAAPSLGAAYLQAIGRWLGVTRYTTWELHDPAMRDPRQAIHLTCGSSTPSTGGSPCTAVLLALTERPVAIATYRQALSQCSKFDQSDVS